MTPNAIARGAGAGAIATAAMSVVMLAAQKAGVMGRQLPEHITDAATGGMLSGRSLDAVALASHFAFGMASGATFAALAEAAEMPAPPVGAGVAFGLAVWAINYAGWVPALAIMAPPSEDRPGRPAAMVAAHVTYGAVIATVLRRWNGRPTRRR